jgi:hypothetical protein
MPVLHVLRVFCDSEGQFGSPLGVVLDGPAIQPERRQPLAASSASPKPSTSTTP